MNCALCDSLHQKYRLVAQNETCFAVICKWPLKPGHVIVMPKRHIASLNELTQEESKDFLSLIETIKIALKKGFEQAPICFQNSGVHATQEHLHFHVVPSKGGLRQFISGYEGVPEREDTSQEKTQQMCEQMKSLLL